jgi:hypothetical protein
MADLDPRWLHRWHGDVADVVGSLLANFEQRMGYPAGDNHLGPAISPARIAAIEESVPQLPADLVTFAQVVGEVSLPDIDNGWFVLSPLYPGRVGPPYDLDVVQFASDGGGTVYAVPAGDARPVLRIREVRELAPGVFDGVGVEESAPDLLSFSDEMRDAISRYERAHGAT